MKISSIAFQEMAQRERACFINCLSGFKSANLVGTYSQKWDVTNLSVISSCFHLGADPALMGLIIRPHSTDRHTLEYILETGEYTINHVNQAIMHKAHQTSARYPREQSEFEQTGLTPHFEAGHRAPFVQESSIRLGLKLREHLPLKINQTELIIGELTMVFAPLECLSKDGSLHIEKAGSLCVSGLDRYHQTKQLARLSYAKPDRELEDIEDQF